MNSPEYIVTPEASYDPKTEVFYAYGLEEAQRMAAEKRAETGRGWKLYLRVN